MSIAARISRTQPSDLSFGCVIWAYVPFDDAPGGKYRPCVVTSSFEGGVTCVPATRTTPRFTDEFLALADWIEAGLSARTYLRLDRPIAIDQSKPVSMAGRLSDEDAAYLAMHIERAGNKAA
jgi:hypothetical protein